MSDPTSTPESVPEPTPGGVCPACGKALLWSETHRCPGPAASSPDEGGEWVCVAGSPLACWGDVALAEGGPGCCAACRHPRPASADEGAPEGCEIDPVSSRGCERGTPGCVTRHADEGTRQRPGGELVAAPSTAAPQADEQIRSDAAWIARLARGSSWPGEMAQRVEDACDRVTLWAAATPPSTPAEPEQADG